VNAKLSQMEEEPEHTLPVTPLFDVKYLADLLPTVSTFAYPLATIG